MRVAGRLLSVVLLLAIQICQGQNSCVDETFSTWEVSFERLRKISRIAVSGLIAGYSVEVAISEETFRPLRLANGDHLIVYSTLASSPSWNHLDLIAQAIRIKDAFNATGEVHRQPLLMLTLCDYDTSITAFDDSGFTVETQRAGLIAMYENELLITFRSFRSGIFFFSMADQGDIIVAQLVRGSVQIIFDFGSLSPSWISGGRALDDGEWHTLRWLHQFDSVQLSIDGVLLNQTMPTGLYRKLDLHSQVHVAGRPMDDFSEGIESSFSGCLARVQLNSIDLLAFAPHSSATCSMPRPPSLTLGKEAQVVFPFSFLPFSFEFRILSQVGTILELKDAENISMVRIGVDESGTLLLYSNATHYKQKSNPQLMVTDGSWHSLSLRIRGNRLEVDTDGLTILWLEGQEVRRVATRLNLLILSASGCYRSATVDFGAAQTIGNVFRGVCNFIDRCLLPGICENGGICEQKALEDYSCRCPDGYTGTNCHTSDLPRSCEEWQFLRNVRGRLTKGRNVTIDPDGGGPLPGLSVLCRTEKDDLGMDVMTTVLEHDLKKAIFVTGDLAPGAIRKPLSYGVGVPLLDFLVEGFEHCQQFMKFSCRGGARLMTHGQDRSPSSWYSTRSDKHGLQWGDAPPYSRMCSCAINGSCLHNRMCNCDSGEDASDEGINSYSQLLPVTGLFLGGTSKQSAIEVEIGALVCRGRISFESVTFNDRNSRLHGSRSFSTKTFDLWIQVKFSHPHMTLFVWESTDNLHWFHLYLQEGRVVAEIVNGGEVVQLQSTTPINNNKWHTIYWEADGRGMKLKVDSRTVAMNRTLILPSALHWTVGSRTLTGNSGYAGVIRNVYLCGEELHLSTMARRESEQGVVAGEDGFCRTGLCKNGGFCVDNYDGYSCDCSMTPFGGEDCSKEYGMWMPHGSSLSIPWQNPAHISMCHRIAIQTKSSNISLVRSKALFADTSFNLTVNQFGQTSVSAYDGELFTHQDTFKKINISDDALHDISFCAGERDFNLTIDGERVIYIEGNWSFFQSFNVWTLLDSNFTGCVSRLQVGASFPLKDAKGARLTHSGRIRFGLCPVQVEQKMTSSVPNDGSSGIRIDAVSQQYQYIVSITTLSVLLLFVGLAILTVVMICYMRSRPDGVYKTNEDGAQNCSPSSYRSEEPLVKNQQNKEYFC